MFVMRSDKVAKPTPRTRSHAAKSTRGAVSKGSGSDALPSGPGQGTSGAEGASCVGRKRARGRKGARQMRLLLSGWPVSLLGCGPASVGGFCFASVTFDYLLSSPEQKQLVLSEFGASSSFQEGGRADQ